MIRISAPTAGSVKSGFFAPEKAAQERLYAAEHVPSATREWGLIFTLLPLPHAAAGILPSLPETGHRAAGNSGHHRTTGTSQTAHRRPTWATSASGSIRAGGLQWHILMKPYTKAYYGPKGQPGTRERRP
jgi:hypothetical protein